MKEERIIGKTIQNAYQHWVDNLDIDQLWRIQSQPIVVIIKWGDPIGDPTEVSARVTYAEEPDVRVESPDEFCIMPEYEEGINAEMLYRLGDPNHPTVDYSGYVVDDEEEFDEANEVFFFNSPEIQEMLREDLKERVDLEYCEIIADQWLELDHALQDRCITC